MVAAVPPTPEPNPGKKTMFEWLKTPSGAYNLTLIVAIVAWVITGIGIFAGFHLNKMRTIDAQEKAKRSEAAREELVGQLAGTKAELEHSKAKTEELASKLARFTVPRQLSKEQTDTMKRVLAAGARGKVVITFLNVEKDASAYAKQFERLFTECGFECVLSDRIWVELAHAGLWICIRDEHEVPEHAKSMESAFRAASIDLKSFVGPAMHDRIGAVKDAVVFVVSNRE